MVEIDLSRVVENQQVKAQQSDMLSDVKLKSDLVIPESQVKRGLHWEGFHLLLSFWENMN